MKKTAFVTGANGFIGSRFCRALQHEGWKVWGLVRKTGDLSYLKGLDIPLVFGDVADLQSMFKDLPKVDYVFHIAGMVGDWGAYQAYHNANVIGTLNVLEYASRIRAKKTVILSSVSVMGFGRTDVTEEDSFQPSHVNYVISKQRMEGEAVAFARKNRMRMTILRPGDVYGENDRTTTLKILKAIEDGSMGFVDSGRALLAPLYVDNLIDAMLKAASTKTSDGRIYNITDGVRITWKEYIGLICGYLGCRMPWLDVPFFLGYAMAVFLESMYGLFRSKTVPQLTRYRIIHGGRDLHFDISKARKELGYSPSTDIRKNLKKTVDWYRSNKAAKKTVLITGVTGFWGYNTSKHLLSVWGKKRVIIGASRSGLPGLAGLVSEKIDLTDKKRLKALMEKVRPDVIIHTAALSKIADCEAAPAQAKALNVECVRELVRYANLYKSRLVFFSTDLVYADGKSFWKETDPLHALHLYERTKIEAEKIVREGCWNHVILRTALSYGPSSPSHQSFLGWIMNAVRKGTPVKLFTDQFRTPISACDGVRLIAKLVDGPARNVTVNFGGHERIDRYSFGIKMAKAFGFRKELLVPVVSAEIKDPFLPSSDTSMDTRLLQRIAGRTGSIDSNLRRLREDFKGNPCNGEASLP